MTPTVLSGDVRETLQTLANDSVHCVVTSPPYWGLRSYLPADHPLKPLEIGSEPTPEAYLEKIVAVFREVRRVLHPSGTVWINVGDSYNAAGRVGHGISGALQRKNRGSILAGDLRPNAPDLKPKDLCLVPERLALALQADGWWIRSRVAWVKLAAMPESAKDRPTCAWEHIWMCSKSERYFYDHVAVRQPQTGNAHSRGKAINPKTVATSGESRQNASFQSATSLYHEAEDGCASLRNYWQLDDHTALVRWIAEHHPDVLQAWERETRTLTDCWSLGPEPCKDAHYATFVPEVPRRAILVGTSAKGACPKCLAPWERVTDRVATGQKQKTASNWDTSAGSHGAYHRNGRETKPATRDVTGFRTIGWRPTCECSPEPCGDCDPCCGGHPEQCAVSPQLKSIPCTVLDPFAGTGCTGAVAIELARQVILCELNPEYIRMINHRTRVTPGLPLA